MVLFGWGFVGLFAYLNAFVWGNNGYIVHLLSTPVPSYYLVWSWVVMIGFICGFNYAVKGGQKYPIGYVISAWWAANIGGITLLQEISYRAIEEQGDIIFGMPSLILDFLALGAIDLMSILVIWFLVRKGILTASILVVGFCAYLVANLFGHAAGAYNLMIEVSADTTAQAYDSYMYLTFTIMLAAQVVGTGIDAMLRWSQSDVDLYRDIRPIIHSFADRHKYVS